jgi:sialate O-acetylesterase
MKIAGNQIIVSFDNTGSGLASKDGKPLSWFTIAGSDMKFVPAKAVIDGKTVIVKSDDVKAPVAVRYAWSGTANPNLMDKEGLPAMPFHSDR